MTTDADREAAVREGWDAAQRFVSQRGAELQRLGAEELAKVVRCLATDMKDARKEERTEER